MNAQRTSHGSAGHQSNDTPPNRGRDGRKTAQDDSSKATSNNPPDHGNPTNGKAAFLTWIGEQRDEIDGFDPDLSNLSDLWEQWRDDSEQANLSGWSG